MIDDLKGSVGASAQKELKEYQAQEKAIKKLEKRISESKKALKEKTETLALKLEMKRLGSADFTAEKGALLQQVIAEAAELDEKKKDEKRKITALRKDQAVIEEQIAGAEALLGEIGGQLEEEAAQRLILKKLYDIVQAELGRYLNAEKRALIGAVENLWEKYAVSSRELERERRETLAVLDEFLSGLRYL